MNPEVKEQWLRALRSGEYEQGRRYLNNNGKFCCLGVLCDLAEKAGVVSSRLWVDGGPGREDTYSENLTEYVANGNDASVSVLPAAVKEWAGIDASNPDVVLTKGRWTPLAWVNDHNNELGFTGIADVIERSL